MIFTEHELKKSFLLYREGFSYEEVLKYFRNKQPSLYDNEKIDILIEAVTSYLKIPLEVFTSKFRGRNVIDGRAIYYYLARTLTKKSLKIIGEKVNRDHATVLNGFNQLKDLVDVGNSEMVENLENIRELYFSYIDMRVNKTKNEIDKTLENVENV